MNIHIKYIEETTGNRYEQTEGYAGRNNIKLVNCTIVAIIYAKMLFLVHT